MTILDGLAKRLQSRVAELGQLVQEQHAVMGQADLTRLRMSSAADQARDADAVMRRTERPHGHQ